MSTSNLTKVIHCRVDKETHRAIVREAQRLKLSIGTVGGLLLRLAAADGFRLKVEKDNNLK